MTDATPTKTRMTLEEFKALPESNTFVEFIDGEVIVSPAPKDPHQEASIDLMRFLIQCQCTDEGTLRSAPTDLHLGADVVQPDVFWVSGDSTNCILGQDGYWHGGPDLVIEILSPSTAKRDRGRKYRLYEQHGVREYWLLDTVADFIEVYHLENGRFVMQDIYGLDETFTSPVLSNAVIDVNAILKH
ncbi:MAG: Uma2 family endonuclease [Burkholderiales bacterium]|nr:Uma2 family endonuclease [Anaerolineae bacterium]